MKPPTFFLSSTIYDFRDLRSAIKFYLEEQGCKVLASEFNDFTKPLDKHSYDACLSTIEQTDYFVLLIGTRVGGWFSLQEHISITQQEYRYAYELQKAGRLKIITFVRAEVWQTREERVELARHLASLAYSDSEKAKIKVYPSKFAEDAEFLSKFIDEVGRNRDTIQALRSGGVLPSGNWIHVFREFSEVVSVMQAQVFSGIPIKDAALRRLLQSELQEVVRRCIPKTADGRLFSLRLRMQEFVTKYPLTLENKDEDYLTIDKSSWDGLSWYAFHVIALEFTPVVLDTAILSASFLDFSTALNAFVESPVHTALVSLREEIRRFSKANNLNTLEVVFENSPKYRGRAGSNVEIAPSKLCGLLHLLDWLINITELSIAVCRYLGGSAFVQPELRPRSPVRGLEEELQQETVTDEEVRAVLGLV